MFAREMMNSFFVEVSPSTSVRLAADLMGRERVGLVCVCDAQNKPMGVLTDRDIVVRVVASRHAPETVQVQQVMTPQPLTCGLDDPVEEVEARMQQRQVGRALVLDEKGAMAGIISLAEIWHHESPLSAAPISRTLSERELRAQPVGGHYGARGHVSAAAVAHTVPDGMLSHSGGVNRRG